MDTDKLVRGNIIIFFLLTIVLSDSVIPQLKSLYDTRDIHKQERIMK